MPTRIPLLFGTMTIGAASQNGVRNSDPSECQDIIDTFFSHGHKELDTARIYGNGTTESHLASLNLNGASIDTKVFPITPGDHKPEKLRATFLKSLEALKVKKVRVFYLHAPDRSVPFEETLSEVNKLHEEGLFEIFGLSNFAAWEVAEVVGICAKNSWIAPKIYQVMYNAITRQMESELLPCARKFGLRLVIYNPLAGGMFAGKITSQEEAGDKGGRFDSSGSKQAAMYRERYVKAGYLEAIKLLKGLAEKHNLRLTEIALRWCQHHSKLNTSDGVILGASSAAQLKQNLEDSEKGPLPEEVVQALDEANRVVLAHGSAPAYWR